MNIILTNLINSVRSDLKENSDEQTRNNFQRFFKEEVKYHGVTLPKTGRIAKKYLQDIDKLGKTRTFELCEKFLKSGYCEEAFIACDFVFHFRKEFKVEDFKLFDKWINKYISNWAVCDTFCNHSMGAIIERYPQIIEKLKLWVKSKNRWVRRAAAVSLILPARRGIFLKDIFEIAETLLLDTDDMVQKGYGWMLKEASKTHQSQVFDFVMKYRLQMPRTALRYAIEKMPADMRSKVMKK